MDSVRNIQRQAEALASQLDFSRRFSLRRGELIGQKDWLTMECAHVDPAGQKQIHRSTGRRDEFLADIAEHFRNITYSITLCDAQAVRGQEEAKAKSYAA